MTNQIFPSAPPNKILMKYRLAILVHSWLSWASARAAIQLLDITETRTVYILSRSFNPFSCQIATSARIIRFEHYEQAVYSYQPTYEDHEIPLLLGLGAEDTVDELILPHIGYYPFLRLASEVYFKHVSFYQESLQYPHGTLADREARLLLDSKNNTTLFTTTDHIVGSKLTYKYYNLSEELIPLMLQPIVTGEIIGSVKRHLPSPNSLANNKIDYLIIAGKAMNSPQGISLIRNIIDCLSRNFPGERIAFKASPSTSLQVLKAVNEMQNAYPTFLVLQGDDSIELAILDGTIANLVTEIFSLCALSILAKQNIEHIISVESIITKDYPDLYPALTERMELPRYRKYALSFQSLSKHVLSRLSRG